MIYLFREPGSHVFISPELPDFQYTLLCGTCEFPVTKDDAQCPRCQRALELCPICSDRTHKKTTPATLRDGVKVCPVCQCKRAQLGKVELHELEDYFCSNAYGCPAGGLLLTTDEYALLPEDSTTCRICRHEHLAPYAAGTFTFQVSRCLFCSTVFQNQESSDSGWGPGRFDALQKVVPPKTGELKVPCALCGRLDRLNGESVDTTRLDLQGEPAESLKVPIAQYLKICEIGRLMMLLQDDSEVSRRSFRIWFDARISSSKAPEKISVAEILQYLLVGTISKPQRSILEKRIESVQAQWNRRVPDGLNYEVPCKAPGS